MLVWGMEWGRLEFPGDSGLSFPSSLIEFPWCPQPCEPARAPDVVFGQRIDFPLHELK